MSAAAFFDAARNLKRELTGNPAVGLEQDDVDAFNAIIATWAPALQPSQAAIDLIKQFEGFAKLLPDGRCQAYPDPASGGDPWTIGFGSTGADVKPGAVWTRQQAEERLRVDVIRFANGVSRLLAGAATLQREYDAMVSLAYNIGLGNFGGSSLLKKHKAGDKAGAAAEFGKWRMAAGKVMKGLIRRRAAEAALYRGQ